MEKHYTLKKASEILGLSVRYIQILDKQGKITCKRTIGGRRRISESEIKRLLGDDKGETANKKLAIYARVSSNEQKKKGDLSRQIAKIKQEIPIDNYLEVYEITDVASGLNDKRKGLSKLIELAREKKIDEIALAYRDRLTRFGYGYLEELFSGYGIKIHIVKEEQKKPQEEELVDDMIAIVTSFAGKLYGMRSKKKRHMVDAVKKVIDECK